MLRVSNDSSDASKTGEKQAGRGNSQKKKLNALLGGSFLLLDDSLYSSRRAGRVISAFGTLPSKLGFLGLGGGGKKQKQKNKIHHSVITDGTLVLVVYSSLRFKPKRRLSELTCFACQFPFSRCDPFEGFRLRR